MRSLFVVPARDSSSCARPLHSSCARSLPPLSHHALLPPLPHTHTHTGKYREHNGIDGTPVNDFLATCCLKSGFCQVLNDYELKHNGKFGMMGAWEEPGWPVVPAADGAPASTEMEM